MRSLPWWAAHWGWEIRAGFGSSRSERQSRVLTWGEMVAALLERDRRSSSYASLIQTAEQTVVGSSGKEHVKRLTEVVADPVEVARLLVAQFPNWMGGDGGYWYDNAVVNQPDRRWCRLRAAIAENGAAFELAGSGIPVRFCSVLKTPAASACCRSGVMRWSLY